MPSQPRSVPLGAPARQLNSLRVESGICTEARPACAMRARTASGRTAASTASVAVLSLWVIMASSTLR